MGRHGAGALGQSVDSLRQKHRARLVHDEGMRHGVSARRKIILLSTALVLLGALFVVGPARRAEACSCVGVSDEEAFAHADSVFTGEVVEELAPGNPLASADPKRLILEVSEVFKGQASARQSIVTARGGSSCGLELTGSGPFVVFARIKSNGITKGAVDGELYADLCGGTREQAGTPIPAGLATGSPPTAGASPIGGTGDDGPPLGLFAVGGGVIVAITVAGFTLRRRLRSSP